MRYIKLSFGYIFHNFWWVLLLSLVPGIILGLFTEPTSIFKFLLNIDANIESGFSAIFSNVSELNWFSLLFGIILLPIFSVFISALCGIESRHMRLGIRDLKGYFKRVNNNILPVILMTIVLLLALQIMALLFSAFSYLWIKTISYIPLAIGLTVTTAVVFMLILLVLVSLLIIWLPTMSITGLNAKKALGTAFSNMRGKIFNVYLAVTLPLIPMFAIMCLMSAYDFRFAFLINIILYSFMVMYFVTLMYVAYCDINDIDREDKKDPFLIGLNNTGEKE